MATIVFVHAFGSSQRAWRPQVEALGERHRVLTPDLPGHGGAPGPFSLERATAALRGLIAEEAEPVHLVAISGGVSVALLTALAEGDRVAGLVASGGVAHTAPGEAVQRTMMSLMPAGVLVNVLKGMYSGGLAEHLQVAVEDLRTAGKPNLLTGVREIGRLDLRPRLGEIKAPTLVLVGEKDKANIPPARELAQGIPDAELRVVAGAGHLWNLEQPELFSQTVADFVSR